MRLLFAAKTARPALVEGSILRFVKYGTGGPRLQDPGDGRNFAGEVGVGSDAHVFVGMSSDEVGMPTKTWACHLRFRHF